MEANLIPLLRLLAEMTDDGEPLLRTPPAEDCAEKVRDASGGRRGGTVA